LEELIKRHTIISEIKKLTDTDLSRKVYYDLFCKDVTILIKYMAALYLEPYNPSGIKKVVLGDIKNLYVKDEYDIKDEILFKPQFITREVMCLATIPHLFEIVDMHLLFSTMGKLIEATLIGNSQVSIYFDFFIVNERTIFFKYEVYKCL
jgi:hypothetical protein